MEPTRRSAVPPTRRSSVHPKFTPYRWISFKLGRNPGGHRLPRERWEEVLRKLYHSDREKRKLARREVREIYRKLNRNAEALLMRKGERQRALMLQAALFDANIGDMESAVGRDPVS